jgi:uncharacterized protein
MAENGETREEIESAFPKVGRESRFLHFMNYQPKEATAVRNDLELLLRLQVIDYDLGELERSKDYLPDMMENLNREMEDAREKLTDTSGRLEEAQLAQKQLELELKSREADLQKYQQQMMSIKTNKEYDALVAQIDVLKEQISDGETKLILTIELIERLSEENKTLQEKQSQVEENNKKQLHILQEKIDSIGDKVTDKYTSRQEVVSSITKPMFSNYERVRKGRGGRAVVAVKKKACSSCFKALTPRKIQEIKRADKVLTCDYCGCLLYWDNEASV